VLGRGADVALDAFQPDRFLGHGDGFRPVAVRDDLELAVVSPRGDLLGPQHHFLPVVLDVGILPQRLQRLVVVDDGVVQVGRRGSHL
jgi:hypothetical protein